MQRLTFDGVNDLYLHGLYGARTLEEIKYMDSVAKNPPVEKLYDYSYVECSTEMYLRHERCVDEHGIGMF